MAVGVAQSEREEESLAISKPNPAPWIQNALVTWWDMEQFSAPHVYLLGKLLERIRIEHLNIRDLSISGSAADRRLTDDRVLGLREFMSEAKEQTVQLGLKMVTHQVEDISANAHILTNRQVAERIAMLDKMIRWEMESHLFFFVSPDGAKYYGKPELLGALVLAKFPNLQYDIVEAGNCYAVGRSTAVVFHLMRIMEVGVQELGNKLGVALADEKTWQKILDLINPLIRALPKGVEAVEMSQVSATLYAIKVAWRNEVMHPNDTYTLEEAENLIRLVKIFMEELATIV